MVFLPSSRGGRRRGGVAVQVVICLTVLLGVAALAVDGGILMAERRHAQATADAAALAAGFDAPGDSDPWITTYNSARNVGSANYSSTTNLTVTPHIPPTSGSFKGITSDQYGTYVEVIVQWNQPRAFSAIFGSDPIPVTARAVARAKYGTRSVSILVLARDNPSAALNVHGNNTALTVPGVIVVDSKSSTALNTSGSGAKVESQTEVDVVGGISSGSNVYAPSFGSTENVEPGAPYVPDPLASLPVPDPNTMTIRSSSPYTASGTPRISPGVYQGKSNSPAITVPNGSTLNLDPGIYYLAGGGLSVKGGGTLQMTPGTTGGVMIYNGPTWGSASPTGVGSIDVNGVINLPAVTDGTYFPAVTTDMRPYVGMSIFQDRNATAALTLRGGAGTNVGGVVYAAKAAASINGGSNIQPGVAFITDTLDIGGGSSFTLPPSPVQIPDPSKPIVRLVE